MAMTSGSQEKVSSEINVTPMIDVLLVLLIIFMVIQPEIKLGETTEIPHSDTQKIQTAHPPGVVIGLYQGDEGRMPRIKVDQEEVAWNDLPRRLQEIYKTRAEKVAFLRGDPEVEFQFVVDVVDMTHLAGVDRIGLLPSRD
ncbi:MAG TPA: biopolymer transporter ExbD [Candidatus Angelobacter sp.]|jgi:biopolymer transport protein ExbD|nr:biopolymer transporter ExbD [Candidatus Angelobacter sp.]